MKDPIKDPDPVGWPIDDNKEDPDPYPIVPHENISFLAASVTFKHCLGRIRIRIRSMLATLFKDPDPVSPDPIAKAKDPDPDPIENRPDPVHCRPVFYFPSLSGDCVEI